MSVCFTLNFEFDVNGLGWIRGENDSTGNSAVAVVLPDSFLFLYFKAFSHKIC